MSVVIKVSTCGINLARLIVNVLANTLWRGVVGGAVSVSVLTSTRNFATVVEPMVLCGVGVSVSWMGVCVSWICGWGGIIRMDLLSYRVVTYWAIVGFFYGTDLGYLR